MQSASDFFDKSTVDQRVKDLRSWIQEKGVRDLEKVPLWSQQLDKHAVLLAERLADKLNSQKDIAHLKQAMIRSIPRHALLKPAHTSTRLRDQVFGLGDRVITVSEVGSVPLSAKGIVVGIQTGLIDVVFDIQFIGGTTLGDRCSPYRGATVLPTTILNLTEAQFAANIGSKHQTSADDVGSRAKAPTAQLRKGPLGGPAYLPAEGLPAGGFHPAPQRGRGNGHQ